MLRRKIKQAALTFALVLPAQFASADWIVHVYAGLGPFGHIDTAIAAMMAAAAPTTSASVNVINFSDGGVLGNFGGDSLFPGNPNTNFGVHITGNILVPAGFNNWYGVNHDDGVKVLLAGSPIITFAAPTPPRNSFGGIGNGGPDAIVAVDIWFYENGGVASLEFFYSDANRGIGQLIRTVPEPGTLALLGLGIAGLGVARRRKVA